MGGCRTVAAGAAAGPHADVAGLPRQRHPHDALAGTGILRLGIFRAARRASSECRGPRLPAHACRLAAWRALQKAGSTRLATAIGRSGDNDVRHVELCQLNLRRACPSMDLC